jgi:DNA-binding transcriptional LysR family regulator
MLTKELQVLGLRHPGLRLELITGTPIAALSRKQTDIALRYGADVQADFVIEKRYAVGFGVYASRQYLRRHGRPETIDGFSGHELIGFDDSIGHVAPLKWVRRGGKDARVTFRSNSLRARAFAATSGVGCALLPSLVGDSGSGLEKIFGPDDVGSLELCLLGNGHVRNSPRVMAVTQYVIDVLNQRSVALAGR